MSTLKTISVIHPSGATTNITNDASGNVTVGNNLTVSGTGVMNIGSGQIYKDASGNVGIGTTSPAGLLNLKSSNGQLVVQNGATAGGMRLSVFNNALTANGYLVFEGYSSEYGRFDASGNLLFNSGYGSPAIAYGCRAWVNYSSTAQTTRGSGNVSSVTYNASANVTVNFTTSMPDGNYAVSTGGGKLSDDTGTSGATTCPYPIARNTGSVQLFNCGPSNGTSQNSPFISCAVFR